MTALPPMSPELSRLVAVVIPSEMVNVWLITPNRTLGGVSPGRLLVNGDERAVIESLSRARSRGPS